MQSAPIGNRLLQLCVLGFGLSVDRDVGVGVFPEGKKIFVRRQCAHPRRLLPNLPSHQGKTPQRSESVGDLALCFDRLHRLWHSS